MHIWSLQKENILPRTLLALINLHPFIAITYSHIQFLVHLTVPDLYVDNVARMLPRSTKL